MSFPAPARRTWFALVLLGAGACTWGEPAIWATVRLDANAAGTRCVIVVAHAAGVPDLPTDPIPRTTGRDSLEVAV